MSSRDLEVPDYIELAGDSGRSHYRSLTQDLGGGAWKVKHGDILNGRDRPHSSMWSRMVPYGAWGPYGVIEPREP